MHRIFLLSPASCTGERARLVLNPGAHFDLARRLRTAPGVPLGELFSFLSGLYFRGKLLYASSFARPPGRQAGVFIITSNEGLCTADEPVTLRRLQAFAQVPIAVTEERYSRPVLRDARKLAASIGPECEVVLLGSVATGRYVDLLLPVFARRLRFPGAFAGRGDMSRGGLLLRCVDAGHELEYVALSDAVRHGTRPPRLQPRGRGKVLSAEF